MALYIRALSIDDLDRCQKVEHAAFPPAEAATREKVCTHTSIHSSPSSSLLFHPQLGAFIHARRFPS